MQVNDKVLAPPPSRADAVFRTLLTSVLHQSSKSYDQIAEELGQLVGEKITGPMLYDYGAKSRRGRRLPAAWVPALCTIVGDDSLARFVLKPRLAALVQLGEALLELGEIDPQARSLAERLQRNGRRRKGRGRR